MCDLWYQLEKHFNQENIKKRGIILHIKINNIEDIAKLCNTLDDYYKDFKYNEIVVQIREGDNNEH